MTKDYGEILCTAIDEIVTTRLQGIQCDITKMCTVVDDTYSYQGKYIVSDGGARFEAFSSDNNYKKGNSVLVTIPNGDFNLQKIIVGRVAQTDTTPFKYTSPLDTMLKISDDALKNIKQSEKGLLANQDNKGTYVKYLSTENYAEFFNNYKGLSRLGIQADFKTALEEYDLVEGSYGLKILLYGGESEENETVWELPFSSSDMIGNPYSFNGYFQQEKVFDISSMYNIRKMEILFYQNGNFKEGDGGFIPYSYKNTIDEITEEYYYPRNLFVNNVKLFFGYELDRYVGETLEIYSDSSESFTAKAPNETKKVILRWIHQNSDQTFTLLDQEDLQEEYFIKWYRYTYGYKEFDEYGGPHWEPLEEFDNQFIIDFLPRLKKTTEEIKVIGLIKQAISDEKGENDQIITTSYYSNILTFKNVIQTVDEVTYDAVSALTIKCLDNSEGNYFIYDQNGKIINAAQGNGTEKQFKVLFKGAELTKEIGTLGYIKWYLPFDNDGTLYNDNFENGHQPNTNTMILKNEILWRKDNGIYKNSLNHNYYDRIITDGVDYIGIKREPDEEGNLNTTQSYMIKNYWSQQDSNNTIRCEVEIDGILYKASEELRFGKAGTSGTNTTFVLDMVGGQNALIVDDENNKSLIVRALLYDSEGKIISIDDPQNIKWSWYRNTLDTEGNDKNYILLPENKNGQNIILTCNTNEIKEDNYYILQAEYGDNPVLYSYLPIPLKKKNIINMEGAREVIYNHQGQPNYYSGPYVLWGQTDEGQMIEIKEFDWKLTYIENSFDEKDKTVKSYLPSLKTISRGAKIGYKALSASTFYASGFNDKICISNSSGWSQPILILQSQYDFSMLNDWDGKLDLNEEDGTMLATMLGAGRKNSNNTFSGVLIGDVYKGTENNDISKETGVYGLHEGILSYGLKDDGTAFFGKKTGGQILIDGNESVICSASYKNNETPYGMKIDLDDGIIDIQGEKGSKIKLSPFNPYLEINSTDSYSLLKIADDNEYFLASNNRKIDDIDNVYNTNKGSYFNLSNGELDIRSPYGEIYMSGGYSGQDESPYLKIAVPVGGSTNLGAYDIPLFYIDKNKYFLQSSTYSGLSFIQIDDRDTYLDEDLNIVSLIVDKDKKINVEIYNENTKTWTEKIFQGGTIKVPGKDENGNSTEVEVKITAEEEKEDYLSSLTPRYTQAEQKTQGFQLDLKNSILKGYDLMLQGTNSEDLSKTFILNSGDTNTPLRIGKNFSVDWDGSLKCNKINSLNNDDRSQYAISIGNNFYVTKGGSAGGSAPGLSCGYATGAGSAAKATYAETAGWASASDYATESGAVFYPGRGYLDGQGIAQVAVDSISGILQNLSERISRLESKG